MASRPTAWQLMVLTASLTCALTACGSSNGGTGQPTDNRASATPTVPADVPSGYRPCEDIPQAVLSSEKLLDKTPDDSNASGGIKWRGCLWAQTDGYATSIRTTNITVDMVSAKGFSDTRDFTIDGRRAVSTRQSDAHPKAECTLNVEMKGGSLEFGLTNPASNRNTGHLDTCDLARTLAEKVVPTIPDTA